MAKEYIYQNDDNNEEYKIDWDKISIYVQDTIRDLNTNNAKYVTDHEIYCDYYGEQIGYLHFSEFHDVNAKDIHPSLPSKYYNKLLYINNVLVNLDFRGWGIGTQLYKEFGEIYSRQFKDWPLAQVFVNPIAEYSFRRAIEKGSIPKSAYVEELIARDYNEEEKQKAKNLFDWLPKDEQKDFKQKMKNIKKEKSATINKGELNRMMKDMRRKLDKALDLRKIKANTIVEAIDASEAADLRAGITFDYQSNVGIDQSQTEETETFQIVANLGGQQAGYMLFTAYLESQKITLDILLTNGKYKDVGFEMMLLAEFNTIYVDRFSGWPLARHFTDPFAELKFRQALEVGWLSRDMLNEEYITRDYSDTDQKFWDNTLKNVINDERVRGAHVIRKDLRKTATNITIAPIEIERNQLNSREHKINIRRDGELLAELKYTVYAEKEIIYVNYIEVFEQYRQNGLASLLYEEFSKDYNADYSGWKMTRVFINPVAEYAFQKAVSEGLFPAETLNSIRRDYNHEDEELWYNELEPKLKDLRKQKAV
ncbi:gp678 [Bacillus phage G]|uniref:Gp678 n=1 Tax=Bacillus phage G TaxID=2884420 RepID=G3MB58_9CAUD|nr:gp678 [Bacillus phage G]AEO93921.1 gp678 [Bacillus phage G]